MLTRAQVAARLGKSIATVRRMEGTALHPRKDANGVHRFCPMEVTAVARAPRTRGWPAGASLARANDGNDEAVDELATERVRALERDLAQVRADLGRMHRLSEENAKLREALMLSLDCLLEQIGPKASRDVLDIVEGLIARYTSDDCSSGLVAGDLLNRL
jgi:hypothetical protein